MREEMAGGRCRYEHNITYVTVEYSDARTPMPETIWNDEELHEQLDEMGGEGWELVSTQPLMRAVTKEEPVKMSISGGWGDGAGGVSWGVAITAGYYFFWRRAVLEEEQD